MDIEKNGVFLIPVAAYHILDVLVCSCKDTTFGQHLQSELNNFVIVNCQLP